MFFSTDPALYSLSNKTNKEPISQSKSLPQALPRPVYSKSQAPLPPNFVSTTQLLPANTYFAPNRGVSVYSGSSFSPMQVHYIDSTIANNHHSRFEESYARRHSTSSCVTGNTYSDYGANDKTSLGQVSRMSATATDLGISVCTKREFIPHPANAWPSPALETVRRNSIPNVLHSSSGSGSSGSLADLASLASAANDALNDPTEGQQIAMRARSITHLKTQQPINATTTDITLSSLSAAKVSQRIRDRASSLSSDEGDASMNDTTTSTSADNNDYFGSTTEVECRRHRNRLAAGRYRQRQVDLKNFFEEKLAGINNGNDALMQREMELRSLILESRAMLAKAAESQCANY